MRLDHVMDLLREPRLGLARRLCHAVLHFADSVASDVISRYLLAVAGELCVCDGQMRMRLECNLLRLRRLLFGAVGLVFHAHPADNESDHLDGQKADCRQNRGETGHSTLVAMSRTMSRGRDWRRFSCSRGRHG